MTSTAFTESEERQELRRAGGQAGRRSTAASTSPRRRAAASKTTDLWLEIGKNGYLGVNIPEEYGGGGGGIGDVAAVCEELAAAGLPAADDGRQPGDLRHGDQPLRHRGAEAALAARASPTAPSRWRSRSPSPTPAPTPTTSPPPPAATATTGCSTARRSTSPASTRPRTCWSSRAPRTRGPASSSPACSWCPTDAAGLRVHADPDGDRQPRAAVPGLHRRRPAARRRAGRRRGRRPGAAVRRAQPRADHGGRRSRPGWPATPSTRRRRTPRSAPCSRAPIGAHQAIAHPLAQSHIEIELARLMTQKAAALYDAGDDMARGRGRQHGEVRRRRGRLRRRRPRRADPRRQRHHPGVRHGRPAGRRPGRPDRAGQPRR